MIAEISETTENFPKWRVYFYVAILTFSIITRNIFGWYYWKNVTEISFKFRCSLHSSVLKKAAEIHDPGNGKLFNLKIRQFVII